MNSRTGPLIALPPMIFACTNAEDMDWTAVGGSKVDGTVILGIDVPSIMGVRETVVQ